MHYTPQQQQAIDTTDRNLQIVAGAGKTCVVTTRELVDNTMIGQTLTAVQQAGQQIRTNHLPRLNTWCDTCHQCDFAGLCRSGTQSAGYLSS